MKSLKRILTLTVAIVAICSASAQSQMTRQEYIDKYKGIAVAHQQRYGIPASITMAQGILESDSGNSPLAAKSNNHFGIKCKSYWTGDTVLHDDETPNECFRAYPSVEQSYLDHAEFLDKTTRYESLFDLSSQDYKGWALGLKKAGYATAPDYAQRLIKIIEDYDLQILDQRDGLNKYATLHGGSSLPTEEGWFADAESNKTQSIDPNIFDATTSNEKEGYYVYRNNRVLYVVTESGDDYEKIADFFRISQRKLRSYNDLPRKSEAKTGEVVYISRKQVRVKSKNGPATHIVREDETFRSIAQDYAITVRGLLRLNKLEVKYTIEPGQELKLK